MLQKATSSRQDARLKQWQKEGTGLQGPASCRPAPPKVYNTLLSFPGSLGKPYRPAAAFPASRHRAPHTALATFKQTKESRTPPPHKGDRFRRCTDHQTTCTRQSKAGNTAAPGKCPPKINGEESALALLSSSGKTPPVTLPSQSTKR